KRWDVQVIKVLLWVQLGRSRGSMGLVAHYGGTIQVAVIDRCLILAWRLRGLGCNRCAVHGIVHNLDRLFITRPKTGSDYGDMQLVAHVRVDHSTDLDGGFIGSKGLDDFTHGGVFTQRQVQTGGDV